MDSVSDPRLRIYKYHPASDAEGLTFESPEVLRWLRKAEGRPLKDQWSEVEVQRVTELGPDVDQVEQSDPDDPALRPIPLQAVDFPRFGRWPVFTERAVEYLRPLLALVAELLPLRCEDERLWMANVLHLSPGLDEYRSEIRRFDTGRIMHVDRYSFDPQQFDGAPMFRLEEVPRGPVLVTGEFVERVEACGLEGFDPQLVWSLETDPLRA